MNNQFGIGKPLLTATINHSFDDGKYVRLECHFDTDTQTFRWYGPDGDCEVSGKTLHEAKGRAVKAWAGSWNLKHRWTY